MKCWPRVVKPIDDAVTPVIAAVNIGEGVGINMDIGKRASRRHGLGETCRDPVIVCLLLTRRALGHADVL